MIWLIVMALLSMGTLFGISFQLEEILRILRGREDGK